MIHLLVMLASPFVLIGYGIKAAFIKNKRFFKRSTRGWIMLLGKIITVCTLFSGTALVFLRYFN